MGCCYDTIVKLERGGKLHPETVLRADGRGVMRPMAVLDVDELARLPRRKLFAIPENPDELCARAFELFEQGLSVRHIVIELRAHKEKIDTLKQEWLDAGGCDLVVSHVHAEQIARHVGPFETVGELCDRIAALATRQTIERETIVADVPEGVSDAAIETAINGALDHVGAP